MINDVLIGYASLHLIGLQGGLRFLDLSQSVVKQNQSSFRLDWARNWMMLRRGLKF